MTGWVREMDDREDTVGDRVPMLDHGYVQLIETWGSDRRIIEAARMSTGKGFLGWDAGPCECYEPDVGITEPDPTCFRCGGTGKLAGDQKLLAYLMNNDHATPFEMAGMIIEVSAPIAVYREWHRHRTQSYNEQSARYGALPNVNYIPSTDRIMLGGGHLTKQAGTIPGAQELTLDIALEYQTRLADHYVLDEELYQWALARGIPKELARGHLPVFRYSRMRAAANLRNWLAFLTLRENPKAQWEIRQYAHEVARLIGKVFSRTHGLYVARRGW